MKRRVKVIQTAFLLFCFLCFGCSEKREDVSLSNCVCVLSTTAMIHDMVKQIGGDAIDAEVLIVGELDPHSYELVKGDDEKFDRADIIFANGLGLEHGASLQYRLEHSSQAILLGNHLLQTASDKVLRVDGAFDPHVWMDISLWAETIDPVVAALSRVLPGHAEVFADRGRDLKKKFLDVHQEIYSTLHEIDPSKRYLVTSHDAFAYFTRAYLTEEGEEWRSRCIAPEGIAPEAQMSLRDIQRVVDLLCACAVPVAFPESNVSQDALRKIVFVCRQKGLDIVLAKSPLYGDSFGESTSYIEMMRHNCETMSTYMR